MQPLAIEEVETVAYFFAKKHFRFDEPIPDFSTRFPGVLESCLATPWQAIGGKDLYPTLLDKAAMLFYLMIKNHPFQNGNKRMAVCTLLLFLASAGTWLDTDPKVLYYHTVWVAKSDPRRKDAVVKAIKRFISASLTQPLSG